MCGGAFLKNIHLAGCIRSYMGSLLRDRGSREGALTACGVLVPCIQSLSPVWFCDPMDCSPPGSSLHGLIVAGILERVAMSSSRGSSQPRDWTHISCGSCIGRRILYRWTTWEAQGSVQVPCTARQILNDCTTREGPMVGGKGRVLKLPYW